jgi:hypothetical protein
MDAFDFKDAEPAPSPFDRGEFAWNILTLLLLGLTLAAGIIFAVIYINPYAGINPFPPPTGLPSVNVVAISTATPTPLYTLEPTWTPAPTNPPTITPTLRPSSTPFPTATVFQQESPTPEVTPVYSFVLKQGSPQAIANIIRTDAGCNWTGVAGQAFSLSGSPVVSLIIQLGGSLNGQIIEPRLFMTGAAPEYGKGGYEFVLGDKPFASTDKLWIQLLDQSSLPMSDKIYFSTYDTCDKNLILINFQQVK